ncbi:MAG TPA: DUF4398 domain-containing protein [Alphaproteobacteria bacterium]|nr:DUF4398 domain-containing protein [Alphaproteobacteria bacterium]
MKPRSNATLRSIHAAIGLVSAIALSSLLVACGTTQPPPELVAAQNAYATAASDPDVAKYASVQLYEAKKEVDRAAKLFADTEDMAEVAHVAKIAERRVKLAETVAEAGKAREEEKMLLESRQKIQMEMREREIAALKARPTDTGMVLTLGGDVLFTTGSSAVSRGAQAQLNRIAQFLIENPDREVVVTGHTDSTGSAATNERLSEERAAAVGSYLATRGVDPSRIATRGMGPSMPIAPNDTASGRQQNRRVDIEILNPGQLASEQVLTR